LHAEVEGSNDHFLEGIDEGRDFICLKPWQLFDRLRHLKRRKKRFQIVKV